MSIKIGGNFLHDTPPFSSIVCHIFGAHLRDFWPGDEYFVSFLPVAHTHRSRAHFLSANLIGMFWSDADGPAATHFGVDFHILPHPYSAADIFTASSWPPSRDRKAIFLVEIQRKNKFSSVGTTYGIGCNPPPAHPLRAVNFHCLHNVVKQIDTRGN
jgi:hypothetical protein